MDFTIREMKVDDATAVNRLCCQLGYPLSLSETRVNIVAVLGSKDHIAFVAEFENTIVGWIGASQAVMIEVMPHCEINGLVIENEFQGRGIGKHLIEKVKQWAREKGNSTLSLHCNIKRTGAHQFYRYIGFEELKQQTNFIMNI